MTKKPRRGNWLITLSVVAAAAAYFVFVFAPGRRAVAELRTEIEQKQSHLTASATLPSAVSSLSHELQRTKHYVTAQRQRAPAEGGLSSLYGRIHELAKSAGVLPTRFEPQSAQPSEQLRRVPINLACQGALSEVHEFLAKLECLGVPLWIDSVQIRKLGDFGESVVCDISLVIFSDHSEISG